MALRKIHSAPLEQIANQAYRSFEAITHKSGIPDSIRQALKQNQPVHNVSTELSVSRNKRFYDKASVKVPIASLGA